MVLAPWHIVALGSAASVLNTFVLELRCAGWRLFILALGRLGGGAGTGEAAFFVAPSSDLVHVGGRGLDGRAPGIPVHLVVAIFRWHIALHERPWILPDRWFMSNKERRHGAAVRRCGPGENHALRCAGVC